MKVRTLASETNKIVERIRTMPEEHLIDAIAEGEEVFRPGVYEQYLKEAQRRLSSAEIEPLVIKKKKLLIEKEAKELVFSGYYGMFFLGLGIGAASQLLFTKGIDGRPVYPSKYRKHGIIIFSISMLFLIYILIAVVWLLLLPWLFTVSFF